MYYLGKFEAYVWSRGLAENLTDLMQKRTSYPQGHVTHWEIRRDFLLSKDMSSAAYATLKTASACIGSWYSVNNQALQSRRVKFPKKRKVQNLPDPMTLKQVRDLIINGKPSPEMKSGSTNCTTVRHGAK